MRERDSGENTTTPSGRRSKGLFLLVLAAALLFSGPRLFRERLLFLLEWRAAPEAAREKILYGDDSGLILFAGSNIPPQESILLSSELDPALIPYYLHPRKIYQLRSDPETNSAYMKLPPSPYPVRRPESFDADWHVDHSLSGGRAVRSPAKAVPQTTEEEKSGR